MNSAAPQIPGTLPLPPATEVPPMTTTAMEASRNCSPILRAAPPEKPDKRYRTAGQHGADEIGDEADALHLDAGKIRRARIPADRQHGAAIDRAMQHHAMTDEKRHDDGQHRDAAELRRGEIRQHWRRLYPHPAAICDRRRLHEETRGQRRDDRRNAQQQDQPVIEDADVWPRPAPPRCRGSCRPNPRPSPSSPPPDSVMVAGMDRSTLPGPSVMTTSGQCRR